MIIVPAFEEWVARFCVLVRVGCGERRRGFGGCDWRVVERCRCDFDYDYDYDYGFDWIDFDKISRATTTST
jgi:hypothetical protein